MFLSSLSLSITELSFSSIFDFMSPGNVISSWNIPAPTAAKIAAPSRGALSYSHTDTGIPVTSLNN